MIGLLGGYFSEQGSESESGGLGNDPVSEEAQSVHPIGNPIIASTNSGFNAPACDITPVLSSPRRAIASNVLDC